MWRSSKQYTNESSPLLRSTSSSLFPLPHSSSPSPPPPTTTSSPSKMSNAERTYIMIKPDGVQRGLIGNIIKRFEAKGFKLIAMKLCSPSRAHLEKHCA